MSKRVAPKTKTKPQAAPDDEKKVPATAATRAAAHDYLEKKLGAHIHEHREELGAVSSGSVAVDYIVGNGGFPRGRISEVFGLESSGKSTLCMMACAKAQAMGLYAIYIDAERSLKREHAEKLGFDPKVRGVWLMPDTFEDTLHMIETMSQQGDADLILVDSVPALIPQSVMEGEISEVGTFGQAAKLFAGTLPRICRLIEKTNTALVFVNQLRANIVTDQWKAKFEPKEKSYGGYALRYYSSLRVELKQKDKKAKTREVAHPTDPGKKQEVAVASRHTAIVFKSKVAVPYQEIEFFIRYDPVADIWGIDNLQTRIDIGRAKGVLDEKGGGFTYYTTSTGDKVTIRGKDEVYDWFLARPDEQVHLRSQIGV